MKKKAPAKKMPKKGKMPDKKSKKGALAKHYGA